MLQPDPAPKFRKTPRLKHSERRLHGRLACELTLNGKIGTQHTSVRAIDLSVSGARVVLPGEFSNSREIVLSGQGLRANLNSTVRAEVVWVRPLEGESGEVMAGLHFLDDPAQLETTWAYLYLRREAGGKLRQRRFQRARSCDRAITLHHPGKKQDIPARLVAISANGGQVDSTVYLNLGANLWLEVPYDEDRKQLKIAVQVVHQQKKGRLWRISLEFLIPEEGRDQIVLQQILAQTPPERAAVDRSVFWT